MIKKAIIILKTDEKKKLQIKNTIILRNNNKKKCKFLNILIE